MLACMMSNKAKNSLNSTACFLYGIRGAWSTIKSHQLWHFVFAIHLQLSMDDCISGLHATALFDAFSVLKKIVHLSSSYCQESITACRNA